MLKKFWLSLVERWQQIIFVYRHVLKIAFHTGKLKLVLVFIGGIVGGLAIIPTLYIDKLLIDTLIDSVGEGFSTRVFAPLAILVALRVLIGAATGFINIFNNYIRYLIQQRMDAELEQIVAKKNAELDMATLDSPEFRDKYTKIERDSMHRVYRTIMPLTQLPAVTAGFIGSLAILITLSPIVALGIFLFSLPQLFADTKFIKKWYEHSTKVSPLYRIQGWLSYYLIRNQNFMELKLLNLPDYLAEKMRKIQEKRLTASEKLHKEDSIAEVVYQLPLIAFQIVSSVWLVGITIAGRLTVGSFQLYLRALSSAHGDLRSLASSLLQIVENYIYVKDLVWFLELEPKIETKKGGKKLDKDSVMIEFKDVWFKYAEDKEWILKGINFVIEPKENIALVGENGSGKSTLIKLLARFYDPNKGEVLINGVNLQEYDLQDWRRHLSMLFQEFETYPFSVKEAIGYGDVGNIENIADIKRAAEMTRMHNFVEGLPKKYRNPLDPQFEKGVKPSMGQRQRLGISRMLFRKQAEIIIMDEPTASVDPEAEQQIFEELIKHARDKILIFVTQRFSTVRLADRIFLMEGGKIIEQGTHKDLIAKSGKYAQLFNLQAKAYQ